MNISHQTRKKEIIPIIMMFNNEYAIPAGVAIYSLLQHANKKYFYELYILHNDISIEHQKKLMDVVNNFPNAYLTFIIMYNKYKELQKMTRYPKEVFYKFCIPSLFKEYKKVIVTDVDVVFLDDISKEFLNFTTQEYFAGVKQLQYPSHLPFSLSIKDNNMHFICGAGYMIYNLEAMRRDCIEQKCLDYFVQNNKYIKYPDQDVLCQVCYPKIKLLHPKNMVLTPWYLRKDYIFGFVYTATKEEYNEAKTHPVQLHFVDAFPKESGKPWKNPKCAKSEIWYQYLIQTPFLKEQTLYLRNHQLTGQKQMKLFKKIKEGSKRIIIVLGFIKFTYNKHPR